MSNINYSYHINLFFDNPFYPSKKTKRKAFFLDRDGVLIKEKHFISDPKDVYLEKGVLKFFHHLYELKIPIVIVTNQSGISRGFFNWDDYEKITKRMIYLVGEKNPIIAIFANGLGPDSSFKGWRKPSPEMINVASNMLDIDLGNSFLIGDRLSDVEAGFNAGIKNLIHLKTGHGVKEREMVLKFKEKKTNLDKSKKYNYFFCENLDSYSEFLK